MIKKTACFGLVVLLLSVLLPKPLHAALEEVKPGVFVEDFSGFDEEDLDPTGGQPPKTLEVVDGDDARLHMVGNMHSTAWIKGREFSNFVLEVDVKKTGGSYAGITVRDRWRVSFQMKGYPMITRQGVKGRLKAGRRFGGVNRLRIVCAGPMLRMFVNGEQVLKTNIGAGKGRVGFYAHNAEAYYDNLRIDTHVDPLEAISALPEAPEEQLVFSPEEPVKLKFQMGNYSEEDAEVKVSASVGNWDDETVTDPVQRQIEVAAGQSTPVEFQVGRLPRGFYCIRLQMRSGGTRVGGFDDLPLAVQEPPSGEYQPPVLPVAAYYKYYNTRHPVYVNTYAHAAARILKEHHFNAVVAGPSFTRGIIDIFQSYGIATIARGGDLDHPAVIGSLVGDEPSDKQLPRLKKQYERLRERTDKPLTTCMVGDGIGLGHTLPKWRELDPIGQLRAFRWYGINKGVYGLLRPAIPKGRMPLASVCRITEATGEVPWWFVLQGFGREGVEQHYTVPTPAQIRGMMHLATAYGADGLVFWALQDHQGLTCLLDQKSLAPSRNFLAASQVAARIAPHAQVLKALKVVGLGAYCTSPVVECVPLMDAKSKGFYVYVVNKNTEEKVESKVSWMEYWRGRIDGVRDVYADRELEMTTVRRDERDLKAVAVTLEPGEGKLLRLLVEPKE